MWRRSSGIHNGARLHRVGVACVQFRRHGAGIRHVSLEARLALVDDWLRAHVPGAHRAALWAPAAPMSTQRIRHLPNPPQIYCLTKDPGSNQPAHTEGCVCGGRLCVVVCTSDLHAGETAGEVTCSITVIVAFGSGAQSLRLSLVLCEQLPSERLQLTFP